MDERYNMIIADDEAAIRKGLSKLKCWEELGFNIVGVYEDGLEVIEHLQTKADVDIILSDIVMNEMSGIDVLKYISENNIDVKMILLSGYSDFEVAQEAIRLGASDYLLKPTVLAELKKAFIRLKNELKSNYIQAQENTIQKLYLEKILYNIILNPNHINMNELWEIIGIKSSYEDYFWVNASILINHNNGTSINDIMQLIKNSLDFEKEWVVVTNTFSDLISILVLVPKDLSIEPYEKLIKTKIESSVKAITDLFDYDIHLQKLIVANNWQEMQAISTAEEIKKNKEEGYSSEHLFASIRDNDYDKVREYLNQCNDANVDRSLLRRIAMLLYLKLDHYYIDIDDDNMYENIKQVVRNDHNYRLTVEHCFSLIKGLEKYLGKRSKRVSMICQYIEDHIYENVTLQSISEHYHYNPSYLSRMFKESTSQSFSSYIKRAKMQHAKAMLNNHDMKIYEIAEKLGYYDVRHFYKVFKDVVNMTPSQYRKEKNIL